MIAKRSLPIGGLIILALIMALTVFSTELKAKTPVENCNQDLEAPQAILSSGWSRGLKQRRSINERDAGFSAANLPQLKLQWSFVFKDAVHPRSVPAVTKQVIILGSEEGAVLALNRDTGCAYWRFQAEDEVRTAISVETVGNRQLVFFGDLSGFAYALDLKDGAEVWKRSMDEHQHVMITGSPVYYGGVLYVPLSSFEAAHAANPFYNCCTFQGGVHAVDATTGRTLWKTRTIDTEPQQTGRNIIGVRQYGPSGAPVWSAPTIDTRRGVLYVGSGQNYSSPAEGGSDAIIAMDLKTGAVKWKKQLQAEDAWNVACGIPVLTTNCPEEDGPDFDFGAPPMLLSTGEGRELLVVGQKSGMVYALDPDQHGQKVWLRRLGRGGILGGVHWGMAADDTGIYVPISDADLLGRVFPGKPNPSISKLDISSGKVLWQTRVNFDCGEIEGCRNGLSSAVTAIDGAVIAPGLDGVIHVYDANTGEEIWAYDSKRDYQGVNGLKGKGGTLDAGGVVVVDGLLLSNSGYGGVVSAGGLEGNVFLVFSLQQ